jgi:hypothetical protein
MATKEKLQPVGQLICERYQVQKRQKGKISSIGLEFGYLK